MNNIYSTISFVVKKNQIARALNVILKNSLTYIKATFLENDDLKITIYSSNYEDYKKVFFENKIDVTFSNERGLMAFFKKNKHRVGLLIGFVMLFAVIMLSSSFVWSINVSGNDKLSDEEVIKQLNEAGFSVGSYVPSIDYKDLHNKVLLNSNDISWISVNITGNVANVLVKERLDEKEKEDNKYTNIVAKYDGQIALVSVIDGKKQISIGDIVRKGDLLISGVLDSQSQGVRYVNAKGSVEAYVNKTINVKIPYESTKKVLTNNVHRQKSYKIFNKNIFFSLKYRNCSDFCDTIEKTEQITLFNKIKLPIYRTTTLYYEYEYQNVTYTKEQAVDLAFKELRSKMDLELKNAELISKNISTTYDENFFYINCELYCLEDIASSVEFYVENNGG